MSDIKLVCSGCGWVYPSTYDKPRCRFCGTKFVERVCPVCGKLGVPYRIESPQCRDCYVTLYKAYGKAVVSTQRWREGEIQRAEVLYDDWIKRLKDATFAPLSEDEWLAACRHFNGCALCDSSDIAARGYFIQFVDGGRYTSWNILPMCEQCTTALKMQINPFKRLNPKLNKNVPLYRGATFDKLMKAYEYLQERLDDYEKQSHTSL